MTPTLPTTARRDWQLPTIPPRPILFSFTYPGCKPGICERRLADPGKQTFISGTVRTKTRARVCARGSTSEKKTSGQPAPHVPLPVYTPLSIRERGRYIRHESWWPPLNSPTVLLGILVTLRATGRVTQQLSQPNGPVVPSCDPKDICKFSMDRLQTQYLRSFFYQRTLF